LVVPSHKQSPPPPPGQLLKLITEIFVIEVSGVVSIVAGKGAYIQITEHRDA
jgi:hypothetical protein